MSAAVVAARARASWSEVPVRIALVLFAATLGVYARVGVREFLNWDDQVYVTDNPHVRRGLLGRGCSGRSPVLRPATGTR
jgi:hypothetical protein